MLDLAAARQMMVDGQIRTNDVTDPRLIEAMRRIPRERFLPDSLTGLSYLDRDVAVGEAGEGRPARYLLKPMTLAKLVQAAEIRETERVLDVGCATGYSAAILAQLAASVVALEEDAGLARRAREALGRDVANVEVATGPLARGWPGGGPFDVIVLEGAAEVLPEALVQQLKDGGRLVCIQGAGPGSAAMLYRKDFGEISGRPIFDAQAPLLPGLEARKGFVF